MSKKRTRDKIISNTKSKVIIKINEIDRVLSENEVQIFHMLINKLKINDKENGNAKINY